MSWAIVIGIDRYDGDIPNLTGAVTDANAFYAWVTAPNGGDVPKSQAYRLFAPIADFPDGDESDDDASDDSSQRPRPIGEPTKDNIMSTINDLMHASEGGDDRLFFYFSGHGLTTTYASRDESALATSGFDRQHTDQTVAVRSLTEFFETSQFEDQFFIIDACRSEPELQIDPIGTWSIPRRRDPGQPPVQQFILYATSPGRKAEEIGSWPGESQGAFTRVLLQGLNGTGRAKAWSWDRNCYEVRWEALATYVKTQMERRKRALADGGSEIQVPQDAGTRGVLRRERDARLTTISRRRVLPIELPIELGCDSNELVDLTALDAVGNEVESAIGVTASPHTLTLLPGTYAIRAKTGKRAGRLATPIDLYEEDEDDSAAAQRPPHRIEWRAVGEAEEEDVEGGEGDGAVALRSKDPLAVAEITDEAGHFAAVVTAEASAELSPGFYRVRGVGPGGSDIDEPQLVQLRPGQTETVEQQPPAPKQQVIQLAERFGGGVDGNFVIPIAGGEPISWAEPSTVLAAAIGAHIHSNPQVAAALDLDPDEALGGDSGVAIHAVAADGNSEALEALRVRIWPAGCPVPDEGHALRGSPAGVGSLRLGTGVLPHWVSLETANAIPTVIALPLLRGRIATLLVETDAQGSCVYQFHPSMSPSESSTPARLRRIQQLERSLLGGRLSGAEALAREIAAEARNDPFAGCVAGYVLLRLGGHRENLGDLARAIIAVAPQLSDAFILRGEYEAHLQREDASAQAFTDAISTGVPAFGEGLTRLIEGLRASGMNHPRAWVVRYIFQQHTRGSMWAAFAPRSDLQPGRSVVTGVDLGYES